MYSCSIPVQLPISRKSGKTSKKGIAQAGDRKAWGHKKTHVWAVCEKQLKHCTESKYHGKRTHQSWINLQWRSSFEWRQGKIQVRLGEGLLNHLYLMLPFQKSTYQKRREKKSVFEYLRDSITEVEDSTWRQQAVKAKALMFAICKRNSECGKTYNCQMLDFFFSVSVGFSLEALKKRRKYIQYISYTVRVFPSPRWNIKIHCRCKWNPWLPWNSINSDNIFLLLHVNWFILLNTTHHFCFTKFFIKI